MNIFDSTFYQCLLILIKFSIKWLVKYLSIFPAFHFNQLKVDQKFGSTVFAPI